jgi:GT2 family glycosyltransferase
MGMWIDVVTPYEPGAKLGFAYNRVMENTAAEWVLFMDHDLFCCNPHWYEMALEGVRRAKGKPVGAITCVTNGIGNPAQKAGDAPKSLELQHHITYAQYRYEKYQNTLSRFRGPLCGFWFLTSKKVWEDAGGFVEKEGLNGVDNYYSLAFGKKGYRLYGLPGLYYYHLYRDKSKLMRW